MSVKLTPLNDIEKLTPNIIRILGLNPGPFTLQGTNTYLVGNGEERILIDTGEGKENYLHNLRDVLHSENCFIIEILITHYHHDHTGGILGILNEFKRKNGEEIPVYKKHSSLDNKTEDEFKCEGGTITAFETPGHTPDHLCFWFNEEKAVLSGDCILGEGTSVFQELGEYMKSLKKIMERKPEIIYPAHGPVIFDSNERIELYINHRLQRESQILKVLSDHSSSSPSPSPSSSSSSPSSISLSSLSACSPSPFSPVPSFDQSKLTTLEIVNLVYKDLPEGVIRGAVNNVNLHLRKLQLEGKVNQIHNPKNNFFNFAENNNNNNGEEINCCGIDTSNSDLLWSIV